MLDTTAYNRKQTFRPGARKWSVGTTQRCPGVEARSKGFSAKTDGSGDDGWGTHHVRSLALFTL
jgi:hypothetical protein